MVAPTADASCIHAMFWLPTEAGMFTPVQVWLNEGAAGLVWSVRVSVKFEPS
jgi:hypothetical protein